MTWRESVRMNESDPFSEAHLCTCITDHSKVSQKVISCDVLSKLDQVQGESQDYWQQHTQRQRHTLLHKKSVISGSVSPMYSTIFLLIQGAILFSIKVWSTMFHLRSQLKMSSLLVGMLFTSFCTSFLRSSGLILVPGAGDGQQGKKSGTSVKM